MSVFLTWTETEAIITNHREVKVARDNGERLNYEWGERVRRHAVLYSHDESPEMVARAQSYAASERRPYEVVVWPWEDRKNLSPLLD